MKIKVPTHLVFTLLCFILFGINTPLVLGAPHSNKQGDEDTEKEPSSLTLSQSTIALTTLMTKADGFSPSEKVRVREIAEKYPEVSLESVNTFTIKVKAGKYATLKEVKTRIKESIPGVSSEADLPLLSQAPSASPVQGGLLSNAGITLNSSIDPLAPSWYTDATQISRHSDTDRQGPRAFDETTGDPRVTIHTIDTGLDFFDRYGFYSQELAPPTEVYGFDSSADSSHGTQVSYITAGVYNNEMGSHGTCPDAQRRSYELPSLLNGPTIGNFSIAGYISDALGLFDELQSGINTDFNVVNMSWGIPFSSPALHAVMMELESDGIHTVAAVGNDSGPLSIFPAAYTSTIGVGATGVDTVDEGVDPQQRAQFSNDGPDLVAPGYRIPVPYYDLKQQKIIWDEGWGTSFATPHVSGALGLLWSYYLKTPELFPQIQDLLANSRGDAARYMREVLERSALDLSDSGFDDETGYGLIQVADAFQLLHSDANDYTNPISQGLSHGIQEWDGAFGGPIFSEIQSRLTSTPTTKFILLDGPHTHGSCLNKDDYFTSIQISRPRFFTRVRDLSITPLRVNREEITVQMRYDLGLDGYARVKVRNGFLGCSLFPISGKFEFDFKAPEGSNETIIEVTLQLRPEGYSIRRVEEVQSPEKEIDYKLVVAKIRVDPSIYQEYVEEQLQEAEIYLREMLEPALSSDLQTMLKQALNATLIQERARPFDYFEQRAFGKQQQENTLRIQAISPNTRFSHTTFDNRSTYAVANPMPSKIESSQISPPVRATGPIRFPQSTDTSASIIAANTINAQLVYLFDAEAFAQQEWSSSTTFTGTSLYPQGVSISFQDIVVPGAPQFTSYSSLSNGKYGEIQTVFNGRLSLQAGGFVHQTDFIALWQLPVAAADIHKEISKESDSTVGIASFEQRLVPEIDGGVLQIFPLDPGSITSYFTTEELEEAFLRMIAVKYTRALSAISTHRMNGNVNIGAFWGCSERLIDFLNYYSAFAGEAKIAEHVSSTDCFDLNLGHYRPDNFDRATMLGDYLYRPVEVVTRQTLDPAPQVATLPDLSQPGYTGFDEMVYQGQTYLGAYVNIPVAPLTANSEVNFSYDGRFRTPYASSDTIQLVEQLWQWRPGKTWVPQTSDGITFLALARDKSELVVSSTCNQEARVEFAYDGYSLPTIRQRETGPLYETTIFDQEDVWMPMDCGGGSGGSDPNGSRPSILSQIED